LLFLFLVNHERVASDISLAFTKSPYDRMMKGTRWNMVRQKGSLHSSGCRVLTTMTLQGTHKYSQLLRRYLVILTSPVLTTSRIQVLQSDRGSDSKLEETAQRNHQSLEMDRLSA